MYVSFLNFISFTSPSPHRAVFMDLTVFESVYHGPIPQEDLFGFLTTPGAYLVRGDFSPHELPQYYLCVNCGAGTLDVVEFPIGYDGKEYSLSDGGGKYKSLKELVDDLVAKKTQDGNPGELLKEAPQPSFQMTPHLRTQDLLHTGVFNVYKGNIEWYGKTVDIVAKVLAQRKPDTKHFVAPWSSLVASKAQEFRHIVHPNLIRVYGMYPEPALLFTEYANMGALSEFLKRKRKYGAAISHEDGADFVIQAAWGLEYLHSLMVAHGRVNAPNCLLHRPEGSEKILLKLSDMKMPFPLQSIYLPPEFRDLAQTENSVFKEADASRIVRTADVWMFSNLIYEIFVTPRQFESKGAKDRDKKKQHEKELVKKHFPKYLRQLYNVCQSKKPEDRPSMYAVVQRLEKKQKMVGKAPIAIRRPETIHWGVLGEILKKGEEEKKKRRATKDTTNEAEKPDPGTPMEKEKTVEVPQEKPRVVEKPAEVVKPNPAAVSKDTPKSPAVNKVKSSHAPVSKDKVPAVNKDVPKVGGTASKDKPNSPVQPAVNKPISLTPAAAVNKEKSNDGPLAAKGTPNSPVPPAGSKDKPKEMPKAVEKSNEGVPKDKPIAPAPPAVNKEAPKVAEKSNEKLVTPPPPAPKSNDGKDKPIAGAQPPQPIAQKSAEKSNDKPVPLAPGKDKPNVATPAPGKVAEKSNEAVVKPNPATPVAVKPMEKSNDGPVVAKDKPAVVAPAQPPAVAKPAVPPGPNKVLEKSNEAINKDKPAVLVALTPPPAPGKVAEKSNEAVVVNKDKPAAAAPPAAAIVKTEKSNDGPAVSKDKPAVQPQPPAVSKPAVAPGPTKGPEKSNEGPAVSKDKPAAQTPPAAVPKPAVAPGPTKTPEKSNEGPAVSKDKPAAQTPPAAVPKPAVAPGPTKIPEKSNEGPAVSKDKPAAQIPPAAVPKPAVAPGPTKTPEKSNEGPAVNKDKPAVVPPPPAVKPMEKSNEADKKPVAPVIAKAAPAVIPTPAVSKPVMEKSNETIGKAVPPPAPPKPVPVAVKPNALAKTQE